MLVEKLWSIDIRKSNGFKFEGKLYNVMTQYWRGWFLFGIIPLYIQNHKTTYSR